MTAYIAHYRPGRLPAAPASFAAVAAKMPINTYRHDRIHGCDVSIHRDAEHTAIVQVSRGSQWISDRATLRQIGGAL